MNARRWPPHDRQEPRQDGPPPAYWQQLAQSVGDMSKVLENLVPGGVLAEGTFQFGSDGTCGEHYRAPYKALAVMSGTAGQLVIAQGAKQAGPPGPGPGSAIVPPLGSVTVNLSGYGWTIYGGIPGELVTVQALTRPVIPSSSGVSGAGLPAGPATVYQRGQATAPVAGTVLAQLAVVPAGWWQLSLLLGFGATAETTTPDNFALQLGATDLYPNLYVIDNANQTTPAGPFLAQSDGVNHFEVVVPANASAGAIYKASIQADAYNA